jgi:hypothetical protein
MSWQISHCLTIWGDGDVTQLNPDHLPPLRLGENACALALYEKCTSPAGTLAVLDHQRKALRAMECKGEVDVLFCLMEIYSLRASHVIMALYASPYSICWRERSLLEVWRMNHIKL